MDDLCELTKKADATTWFSGCSVLRQNERTQDHCAAEDTEACALGAEASHLPQPVLGVSLRMKISKQLQCI